MPYIVQVTDHNGGLMAFVKIDHDYIDPSNQLWHTRIEMNASHYDTQEAAQSVAETAGRLRPQFTYTVREV